MKFDSVCLSDYLPAESSGHGETGCGGWKEAETRRGRSGEGRPSGAERGGRQDGEGMPSTPRPPHGLSQPLQTPNIKKIPLFG